MPFQSEKQRRYMWANHPAVARRWARKYGDTPSKGKYNPKKKLNTSQVQDFRSTTREGRRNGLLLPLKKSQSGAKTPPGMQKYYKSKR